MGGFQLPTHQFFDSCLLHIIDATALFEDGTCLVLYQLTNLIFRHRRPWPPLAVSDRVRSLIVRLCWIIGLLFVSFSSIRKTLVTGLGGRLCFLWIFLGLRFRFPFRFELLLELCNAGTKRRINRHEEIECFKELNKHCFVTLFHLASDARVFLAIWSATPTTQVANREQPENCGVNVLKYETLKTSSIVLAFGE